MDVDVNQSEILGIRYELEHVKEVIEARHYHQTSIDEF